MYIVVDNSAETGIILQYCIDGQWHEYFGVRSNSGSLLCCLAELFAELNMPPTELRGLMVVVGQGKFTSTRVATTVANALSVAWAIPVIGIDSLNDRLEGCKRLKKQPVGQYILPTYSGQAHIGGLVV